jgi:hypothetical protein
MRMPLIALALAAGMGSSLRPEINSDYTQERDRLREAQAKAMTKKQRVRDEIRTRRKAMKEVKP